MQDHELNDLFAAAKARRPAASDALMARVLADADAHQPRPQPLQNTREARGLWAMMLAAIGGAGGLAGLSTAALAGVWLGFAQPAAITTVTDAFLYDDTVLESVELFPAFDDILTEG